MEPFSYPASNHSDQAAPAEQKPAYEPAKSAEPLAYSEMNKEQPTTTLPVPDNIKELREKDDARGMFGAQSTYKETIPIDESWPEENKAAAREWLEIFADTEISPVDARELVGVVQGLSELPTDEVRAGWEKTATEDLRRAYGADAQQALADARAFVARDSRLANFLHQTGLGSHPAFVRHAVCLARQQRARGRL
jgi:hypothetical protein